MAIEIETRAWKTRLGNSTAKNVLARLANHVNADGVGWPSLGHIADCTEVNIRTVMRIVQVFRVMGLLTKIDRGRRAVPAWRVNLGMLNRDLSREFAEAYALAQGKAGGSPQCRSDSDQPVAETLFSVAETEFGVAATVPPHPLKGGTVKEPSRNLPRSPQRGPDDFMALDRAVDQVCSALAIAQRRKRKLLRDVIALEAEKGDAPATIALAVIAAVRDQAENSYLLTVTYGLEKFLGLGIWKDRRRWHWNEELLRRQREARVGCGQ